MSGSNGKAHAVPPEELRDRIEAVVPDGENTVGWLVEQTGYAGPSRYSVMSGNARVTARHVAVVELLERIAQVDGRDPPPIGTPEKLENDHVRSAILDRMERLRDRVRKFRLEVRTEAAAIIRQAEELDDTLTRAIGE